MADDYDVVRSRAVSPLFYKAPAPANVTPMQYQLAGVEYGLARDHHLFGDAPGLGKTAECILLGNAIRAKHSLVICPASLRLNWEREIWTWSTIPNVSTYPVLKSGDGVSLEANYVIISYALLANPAILDAILDERWDHVILDECFPGGTLVSTEHGEQRIGDLVTSRSPSRVWTCAPDGTRRLQRVTRFIRSKAPDTLLEIRAGEHYVSCTGNHKIWTREHGYIRAEDVKVGDTLRVTAAVHACLESREPGAGSGAEQAEPRPEERGGEREGARGGSEKGGGKPKGAEEMRVVRPGGRVQSGSVLQQELFREVENQAQAPSRAPEETASGVSSGVSREEEPKILCVDAGAKLTPGISRQTGRYIEVSQGEDVAGEARRERFCNGSADDATASAGLAGGELRVPGADERGDGGLPTHLLQGGLGLPRGEGRDRSGRFQPSDPEMEVPGRPEDRGVSFARVESVKVVELRSDGRSRGGCGEGHWVYDLEVEEDHNYFANGVLVSNCHAIKDPKGNTRTRAICAPDCIPRVAGRMTLASGTILPNAPIEVYNCIRLLNWEAINKASLEDFRETYYDLGGGMIRSPVFDPVAQVWKNELHWSDKVRNVPVNLDDLQYRLRKYIMVRRLKEQVLHELPPKQWHPFPLEVTSEMRRALKHPGWATAEKLYAMDPDSFNDGIPVDGAISTARKMLGEAKMPSVAAYIIDLLESGVDKLVVTAWHTSVLHYLRDRLSKYGLVYMDGSTSAAKKQAAVDQFQQQDKIRVIIGQTAVIGEGWTLTKAQDVVLAEPDWVPGRNDQALDRIHRKGHTGDRVIGHIPVVPGTLDERVMSTAIRKDKAIYAALDHKHS